MRPASSAGASRPNPRAWPASGWGRCASRSARRSPASSPPGARLEDLVLPGPGGSNGIPRSARAPLSTNNLRRVYKAAVEAAGADPAMVARVTAALDDRIGRALAVAAYLLREGRDSRAVDGREAL